MRRSVAIAALAAVLVLVLVLALLLRSGGHEAPDRGTVRVVEAAPNGRPGPTMSAAPPAAPPAIADAAPVDAILRALRMPPDTRITALLRVDPRVGLVCGTVVPPDGHAGRFVFLQTAGMAALDDRSGDFAALHRRLCGE